MYLSCQNTRALFHKPMQERIHVYIMKYKTLTPISQTTKYFLVSSLIRKLAHLLIYIEVYQITIFYTQLNAKRRLQSIFIYVYTSAQRCRYVPRIKYKKTKIHIVQYGTGTLNTCARISSLGSNVPPLPFKAKKPS